MSNEVLTKVGNKAEWAAGGVGGGNKVTLYAVPFVDKDLIGLIRNIPSNWHDIIDLDNFTAPFMEDVLSVEEQIVAFNKAYDAFFKDGEVKLIMLDDGMICLRAVAASPKTEKDGKVTPAQMTFTAYMKKAAVDMSITASIKCTENGISITL